MVGPAEVALTQLRNLLLIVLLVAAAISLAIGETLDAAVIGAVIVLNTIIGFIQE